MGRTKAKLTPEADRSLKQIRNLIAEQRRQVDSLQSSKYHNCCGCQKTSEDLLEGIDFMLKDLMGDEY